MPEPGDVVARAVLTRRQGLFALALAATGTALAACTSSAAPPASSTAVPTAAPVSPTVADEQSLVLLYDQAIAAQPSLAAVLQPIRDQHLQHLTALGSAAPEGSAPALSGSASTTSASSAKATLQSLIDAETSAAQQRADAAVTATDPQQARTLTFIAASEASHVPALKAAR